MARAIRLPHTMLTESSQIHNRLLWASEVGRQICMLTPSQCDVSIPENATTNTVFNRLTFLKHQFVFDERDWHITNIEDVPLRIFGSSPNYQTCPLSLLSLRFHMVAAGQATMTVDFRPTKLDPGCVKASFRFFIETNRLFSKNIHSELKFIFGKGQPRFNTDALKAFSAMMKHKGVESLDPPPDLQDKVCRAGVITAPIQFQVNTIQAMRVMEDPDSSYGLRHVRNSEELQTSIWPRDSPIPILFAPYTMTFSLRRTDAEHTGGLLALGPGLGKTLIMIAHTMLKREEGMIKHRSDIMGRCAIGTVVVADPHLHTHWREQIALHAPSAIIGDDDSILRPRKKYADFVIVTIHQLLDLTSRSPLKMNRLCYDEAHVLAAKISKLQSQYHIPSNADHLWAITATPSHAKYLSENFGNITKVLRIPAVNPACCKYYPDTFNGLRKMIISGGTDVIADQLLPSLITINTHVPLNDNDMAELQSILHAPHVTLDPYTISRITRAVQTSESYEKQSVVGVVNSMPAQYGHLPVVNSAALFMDEDCCVCYEPMVDRVALPCHHTFCFQCLSMIATNQVQRNCAKCRVPFTLGSVSRVVEEDVQGPAPAPVITKSLWSFTTSVDAVAAAVQANEERANSGKTIIFCDTEFVITLSTHLRLMHNHQSLFYLEDMSLARQETAISLFKTDATKRVLVIDIALNAGLDLPCADNIIFACREPMSPDSHVFQQAVGRIRRLSQNSPTVRANILHFEGRDRIKEVLGYVEPVPEPDAL